IWIFAALAVALLCIPGSLLGGYNRGSGNAIASSYPLTGIRYVAACNSGKRIRVSSCEARNLVGPSVPRIERGMLYRPFFVFGEGKSPTIPIGLPTALISSLLTAIFCSTRLARHRQEKG